MTETDTKTLDKQVAKKLRKMMGIKAYWFDGEKLATFTNEELRQYWQIPKIEVELRVHRIRWLQTMLKDVKNTDKYY